MIRGTVSFIAGFALVALVVVPAPAAKAVTGGARCAKSGQYVVSGSRVYVCQSTQKWKVHSNVQVSAACPKKGLAARSPSGEQLHCTRVLLRLRWVKATAATLGPTQSSSPSEGQDLYALYGVHGERFRAVDRYASELVKKRDLASVDFEALIADKTDARAILIKENFEYAISLFNALTGTTGKFYMAIDTNPERLKQTLQPLCPFLTSPQAGLFGNNEYSSGAAGCDRVFGVLLNPEYRNSIREQVLAATFGGHEGFHLYQMQRWKNRWDEIPGWFREGSAHVATGIVTSRFGSSTALKTYGKYGEVWESFGDPWRKSECAQALVKWRDFHLAMGHQATSWCEGGLGRIMSEYLVLRGYGLSQVLDTYELVGRGVDFAAAFHSVYGFTAADFYRDVEQYLDSLHW